MLLEPHDVDLFFRLHRALMFFVNQRLKVIPDTRASPEEFAALPPGVRLKVRDGLSANPDLIESFAAENPARLSDDELDIVRSWRHLVAGRFYVFRELKKYTVFLSTDNRPVAYGALALSQLFEDLIGPYLPVLTQTVLLPFKDKIVYDGLMSSYNVSFGPGIRRNLHQDFKEAKQRHGIVTSLPMSATPKAGGSGGGAAEGADPVHPRTAAPLQRRRPRLGLTRNPRSTPPANRVHGRIVCKPTPGDVEANTRQRRYGEPDHVRE